MRRQHAPPAFFVSLVAATVLLSLAPTPARADCDTLVEPLAEGITRAVARGLRARPMHWIYAVCAYRLQPPGGLPRLYL